MSFTRTHTKNSFSVGKLFLQGRDPSPPSTPQNGKVEPTLINTPLQLSKALDPYSHRHVTPVMGEVFHSDLQITDILDQDDIVKDLAITIARRGFVAFKAQDHLTPEQMKAFCHKLGLLSGKPSTSALHIHPLSQKDFNEDGSRKVKGGETISSEPDARGAQISGKPDPRFQSTLASNGWHT